MKEMTNDRTANDELPEGWAEAPFSAVTVDPVQRAPASDEEITYIDIGSVDRDTKTITQPQTMLGKDAPSRARKVVKTGDVLVSTVRPNLNAVALVDRRYDGQFASTGFDVLRSPVLDPRWVFFSVRTPAFVERMTELVQGALYPAVRSKDVRAFTIPIAPLAEQKRIADKLEAVLGRVDACRARLDRVPELLKRFRQSVLAAATSGHLTEGWLEENGSNDEWENVQVRDIADEIFDGPFGSHLKTDDYTEAGVRVVRLENIGSLKFFEEKQTFISPAKYQTLKRHTLKEHDVIFSSFISEEIRVSLLPKSWSGKAINKSDCFCVRADHKKCLPKFLAFRLACRSTFIVLGADIHGATRPRINLGQLKEYSFELPKVSEQQEIVRRVEALFAFADRIEARLTAARAQVERLTPATLSKAFRGDLVPQDPNDEPASALLSRFIKVDSGSLKRKESRSLILGKKATTKSNPPAMTVTTSRLDTPVEPLSDFKLHRLKLNGRFGRLLDFDERLRITIPKETTPICMVGLNGSGKSNVLEALSEIFTHLELVLLPWHRGSKRQTSSLSFELEYSVRFGRKPPRGIKIWKGPEGHAQYSEPLEDGSTREITSADEQRSLLPRRIVGYSSGMNETLSLAYFKLTALYVKEVSLAVRRGQDENDYVAEPRSLFIDYESNAAILLANFLFSPPKRLHLFKHHLRVEEVESFTIRFNAKPPALRGGVKLTGQLTNDLDKIAKCAGITFDPVLDENIFDFSDAKFYRKRFADVFPDGGSEFFMALHRLSLLNALCVHSGTTDEYERNDPRAGSVDRPQTVARLDRIFSIENVKLRLSSPTPKPTIPYESLSDGEHQFIEIFGTVMLFDEPGTLFLFDEPESHFNPAWRSQFVQILTECGNVSRQELALSTHSPFIVSGCRGESVFKFERKGDGAICKPAGFETYGSSFDYLLTKLFNMDALIATQPLEGMKRVFKSGSLDDLERAVVEYGDSFEKRFLFQRIAEKKSQKRKKTAKKNLDKKSQNFRPKSKRH